MQKNSAASFSSVAKTFTQHGFSTQALCIESLYWEVVLSDTVFLFSFL